MKWRYRRQVEVKYIRTKGKLRKITTYKKEGTLKKYHKEVVALLENHTVPSEYATAYIKDKSIIQNARAHMYNDYFILMDIQNFFGSITHAKLAESLYRELNQNNQSISKEECTKIVDNVSTNNRGIPLGFITSPMLANLYLKEFDQVLYGELKKLDLPNVVYTRYADDMVVSWKASDGLTEGIYDTISSIVSSLLASYSLKMNYHKTRVIDLNKSNHVKITGINVCITEDGARKLTIGRKEKNELFWRALKCCKEKSSDRTEALYLKGMQSYILSIESTDYEKCFSQNMLNIIYDLGYHSLKELIDVL